MAFAHESKSSVLASDRLIALYASRRYASSFCILRDCLAHCLAQMVSTCSGLILLVPLEMTRSAGSALAHTVSVWFPPMLVASCTKSPLRSPLTGSSFLTSQKPW